VYHYYDDDDAFDNGDAWVQVRPLTWVDGWPVTGRARREADRPAHRGPLNAGPRRVYSDLQPSHGS